MVCNDNVINALLDVLDISSLDILFPCSDLNLIGAVEDVNR